MKAVRNSRMIEAVLIMFLIIIGTLLISNHEGIIGFTVSNISEILGNETSIDDETSAIEEDLEEKITEVNETFSNKSAVSQISNEIDVNEAVELNGTLPEDNETNENGFGVIGSELGIMYSGDGDGSVNNPYNITNCTQLQEMANNLVVYYILGNDVNCSDTVNWNHNGSDYLGFDPVGQFSGNLQGQDYVITGLYIFRPTESSIGLFSSISSSSKINYIGLEDVDIIGKMYVGGLVGINAGQINNSYTQGVVRSTSYYVGGLVGHNSKTITNSYFKGQVNSTSDMVGGLVGRNIGRVTTVAIISGSYTDVNVSGRYKVGGLVGSNNGGWKGTSLIIDSYSKGNAKGVPSVSIAEYVGGLVGSNYGMSSQPYSAYINNSFSISEVSCQGAGGCSYVGGFAGENNNATITASYWDNETSGKNNMCGIEKNDGIGCDDNYGKTTVEMKNQSLYTIWDFLYMWSLDPTRNEGYPYLYWQYDYTFFYNFNLSYGSTNFSDPNINITNVTNMTLATQYGKIQFPIDHGVDASNENYDVNVRIGNGFVSVNTANLDVTFNATANITINNVSCPATVYYASGAPTSVGEIIANGAVCNSGTDPVCTNINCVGTTLTFTISHFTGFASAATANLTMWDETDLETKYIDEDIGFFVNYTNTTWNFIDGANCTIWFNDTAVWKNMSWNDTFKSHEYNRSFSSYGIYKWNVSCNKSGYDSLNTNDTVVISSVSAPSETVSRGGGGSYSGKIINTVLETAETRFELRKGDKVIFDFKEEKHEIKIASVTESTATITVSSTSMTAVLNILDEMEFDLDDDGKKDISITLKDLKYRKAILTLRLLEEEIIIEPEEIYVEEIKEEVAQLEEEPKPLPQPITLEEPGIPKRTIGFYLYIILIFLLFLVLFSALIFVVAGHVKRAIEREDITKKKLGLFAVFSLIAAGLVICVILIILYFMKDNLYAFLFLIASVALFIIVYTYINYERAVYHRYLRYNQRREKELAEKRKEEELGRKEEEKRGRAKLEEKKRISKIVEKRKQEEQRQREKEDLEKKKQEEQRIKEKEKQKRKEEEHRKQIEEKKIIAKEIERKEQGEERKQKEEERRKARAKGKKKRREFFTKLKNNFSTKLEKIKEEREKKKKALEKEKKRLVELKKKKEEQRKKQEEKEKRLEEKKEKIQEELGKKEEKKQERIFEKLELELQKVRKKERKEEPTEKFKKKKRGLFKRLRKKTKEISQDISEKTKEVSKGVSKKTKEIGKGISDKVEDRKKEKSKTERAEQKELEKKKQIEDAAEIKKLKEEEQRRRKESSALNKNSLNDYIVYSIKRGKNLEQIKETLVKRGWPKGFVSKYCNRYFKIHGDKIKKLKKEGAEEILTENVGAQIEAINKKLGKLR